jgi:hypothetical protein
VYLTMEPDCRSDIYICMRRPAELARNVAGTQITGRDKSKNRGRVPEGRVY